MEEKRLDLDAPLLSVRRSRAAPAPSSASAPAKSSLRSIPFLWEQTPGLPKDGSLSALSLLQPPAAAPNPPPGRIFADTESNSSDFSTKDEGNPWPVLHDEDQALLDDDAAASGSSAGSPFMTCSTSSSPGASEASESFVMDPETRDFMMARFLPAAQAVATGLTPQRSSRRLRAASVRWPGRRDEEITHEEVCSSSTVDDEDEEEEDGEGSSKSCGLIPQFFLKSSTFCLLNPVQGTEVRSRRLQEHGCNSLRHRMLDQSVDENMWEAVYKYKLGQENQCQGEERSKVTSESNRLTYWSDSQTHDGSSSFRCSVGAVTSPYGNEMHRSPSSEGKKFLGVLVKEMESRKTGSLDSIESDGRNYSVLTTSSGGEHGSGSASPAIDRTLYIDSANTLYTPNSRSLSATADTKRMTGSADDYSGTGTVGQMMEQSLRLDAFRRDAAESKVSDIVDSSLSSFSERSICKETDEVDCRRYGVADGLLSSKVDDKEQKDTTLSLSLLPPPLPKSPSQSWLRRTLPSVSSKKPYMRSMLGVQFQPREQLFKTSMKDPKRESNSKPSIASIPLVKYAEVIPRPVSPCSEM